MESIDFQYRFLSIDFACDKVILTAFQFPENFAG